MQRIMAAAATMKSAKIGRGRVAMDLCGDFSNLIRIMPA
jgi:hypothetical protein